MVPFPLLVLAVPSLIIGGFLIGPMLFGDYFGDAIYVAPAHDVLGAVGESYYGIWSFTIHAFQTPAVYISLAGVVTAWLLYIKFPQVPEVIARRFSLVHRILLNKYGFDDFNQAVFAGGTRGMGNLLWRIGDVRIIDGVLVNGTARAVRWASGVIRHVQSGYLYDYAFAMIIGLLILLAVFVHQIFV